MKINKYFPFSFIYFFLNSLGLPFGLTYTALLSPFLYLWVVTTRRQEIILPFFAMLTPFVIVHTGILGVNIKAYFISFLNITAIYIFCQAAYTFFKKCEDPEKIFRRLLIINFILCLVAIPFYFTPYYNVFWIEQFLTEGIYDFKRFKLFTYEASHYATLFIPLFFFYFLQIILNQNKINAWILLPMLLLPYILSFALGVMSTILVVIGLIFFFYFKTLMQKKRVINILGLLAMIGIPVIIVLILAFPENTLFTRIENIFSGEDPSGRGRTSEAFILADKLLDIKSHAWGVGLGQIKLLGSEIIRDFYLYPLDYNVIGIPNAAAETLAIFGWIGLCIRLLIQLFLFFHTRVWLNYYRLSLFLFMFLYQFTGSFITNIAEYIIWILAFTEVFPQFRVRPQPEMNIIKPGLEARL